MTAMFIGLVSAYLRSYLGGWVSGDGVFSFKGSMTPLLTALCAFTGMPEPRAMVTRTRLLGETEAGAIVPLEEL